MIEIFQELLQFRNSERENIEGCEPCLYAEFNTATSILFITTSHKFSKL